MKLLIIPLSVLSFFLITVFPIRAQESPELKVQFEERSTAPTAQEVKERMSKNLAAIDKLKQMGKIGETDHGFLLAREKLTEAEEKLVKSENADRKYVYEMLAAQTNSTADKVGRTRATQIRGRSTAGMWFLDSEGNWRQKSE